LRELKRGTTPSRTALIYDSKVFYPRRINIMHHVLLTVAAGVTVLATGAFMPSRAEALPLSASFGANLAVEALAPVENVALCFYVDGWNGPGFYECGFRHRQGQGWHGARGGDDRNGRGFDRNRRGEQTDGRGNQTDGRGRH
jgi:hypothetical protein